MVDVRDLADLLPNLVVKMLRPFQPDLRTLAPLIGRKFALNSDKARRVLGFAPRPATATVIDCAESLLRSLSVRAS